MFVWYINLKDYSMSSLVQSNTGLATSIDNSYVSKVLLQERIKNINLLENIKKNLLISHAFNT